MTTTTTKIQEAIQSARALDIQPSWGDAKRVFLVFGITRTPLYRLMASGLIRTTSLAGEGAARGKRLFYLPSIAAMLEEKSTGGKAQ